MPLHPRTRKIIESNSVNISNTIYTIEPVGYLEMVYLINNCSFVMTDSGGLQKEAYFYSKPCITLRNETEWVELVENGVNFLTGTIRERILDATVKIKDIEPGNFQKCLYGDGNASAKIVKSFFK